MLNTLYLKSKYSVLNIELGEFKQVFTALKK
jgi:hypothetical protein